MTTKAQKISTARWLVDSTARDLQAHEKLWREEWDAYPCAFIAVERYCNEEARAQRQPVIQAWLDAVESLYFVRFGRHSVEQKSAKITAFLPENSMNFSLTKEVANKPKFQTKAAI